MLSEHSRVSRISLVALPRPLESGDYVRASEEIDALLRSLPGIVAVYQAGSVSVPGISDLDRIAVVEGAGRAPPIWSRLSEKSRYLAMHTPFLVDRATFQRHRWFAYLEPLELSSGSRLELDDRPVPRYSEPLMGAESLVMCLARLAKQTSTGLIKARQCLCELNNVRHGLALARLSRDEAPAAWRVADDIGALRRSWFASPDEQRRDRLKEVAVRAVPALLEALWALGEQNGDAEDNARETQLGPPLSNVILVPTDTRPCRVGAIPRMRVPLVHSSRISDLRWRAARPKVPVHPSVISLLTGTGTPEHREFRSARNGLVRSYTDFLTTYGRGYSPIGLASPFLPS
jgi:hypothetical protein